MSAQAGRGGVAAVASIAALRLARTGKLRLVAALTVGLPLAVVVSQHALAGEGDGRAALESGLRWVFFGLAVLLCPYVLGAGVFAEEIERRTLQYTLVRPVGRATLWLGRVAAVYAISAACLVAGVLVLHVGLFATDPAALVEHAPASARALGALLLALAYTTVAASFWSAAAPDLAYVLAALHFGLVEFLFGMAPGVLRVVSMGYLASELAGLDRVGLLADRAPEIPAWVLASVIAAFTAVVAVAAIAVVKTSELRLGKS